MAVHGLNDKPLPSGNTSNNIHQLFLAPILILNWFYVIFLYFIWKSMKHSHYELFDLFIFFSFHSIFNVIFFWIIDFRAIKLPKIKIGHLVKVFLWIFFIVFFKFLISLSICLFFFLKLSFLFIPITQMV